MFAALPRLGNEIAMLFQPIPSANGTDKFVEIRLSNANSKNVLVSMTNNIVIFFFFLLTHCRITRDITMNSYDR